MGFDRYSVSEEIANSLTHVLGVYVGVVFSTLICQAAFALGHSVAEAVAMLVYCVSMTLMFTMSASYHAIQYWPAKKVLKILDHIAIYFAIAGMYTPVCMCLVAPVSPRLAKSIIVALWIAVFIGAVFKAFTAGRYKAVSTIMYVILGWAGLIAARPIWQACTAEQLAYLGIGGLLYTVGSGFYMMKSVKWMHSVWHILVLVAGILHMLFVYSLVRT